MYRLKIKKFQSIPEAELSFSGFTTLIGKSNRGKSAIIRALKTILLNEWNASFVKYGEKETELCFQITEKSPYLLSLFPGFDVKSITLEKPKNEYKIFLDSGVVLPYPKIGKGLPEKFKEMNLNSIETERGDSFNLNFQSQLDPLFLLTSTDVEITSFINKVFDISRFEKALREMKTDDIKLSKGISENENLIQELNISLRDIEKDILDTGVKVSALETKIKETDELTSRAEEIQKDIFILQKLLQDKESVEKEKQTLYILKKIEGEISSLKTNTKDYSGVTTDVVEYIALENTVKDLRVKSGVSKVIVKTVSETPLFLTGMQEISKVISDLSVLEKNRQTPVIYTSVLQNVKRFIPLFTGLQDMSKIQGDVVTLNKQKIVPAVNTEMYLFLSQVKGICHEYDSLLGAREGLGVFQESYSETKYLFDKTRVKKDFVSLWKESIMSAVGICPICNSTLGTHEHG